MKTLTVALALGFVAAVASAQTPTPTPAPEDYTVSANSSRVGDIVQMVQMRTEKLCAQVHQRVGTNPWSPAYSCTQGQICLAVNAPGGASCTAAQARGAGVRLFPTTQAGREEFVTFGLVLPQFQDQLEAVPSWQRYRQCLTWQAGNAATRDSMCTQSGLSAGCRLYGSTCS